MHRAVLYATSSESLMSVIHVILCVILLVDTQPDTFEVDRSEIRTQIMLATASFAPKGRQSFTHMLTEVRPQRYKLKSLKGAQSRM